MPNSPSTPSTERLWFWWVQKCPDKDSAVVLKSPEGHPNPNRGRCNPVPVWVFIWAVLVWPQSGLVSHSFFLCAKASGRQGQSLSNHSVYLPGHSLTYQRVQTLPGSGLSSRTRPRGSGEDQGSSISWNMHQTEGLKSLQDMWVAFQINPALPGLDSRHVRPYPNANLSISITAKM